MLFPKGDDSMRKSCSYCGGIHTVGFKCPMKPKRFKQKSDIEKFRSGISWQKKRSEIAERDLYLCRVCLDQGRYSNEIQVHHITPLASDFSLRLENDNLISLCPYHHEQAEAGLISPSRLRLLAASPPEGMADSAGSL